MIKRPGDPAYDANTKQMAKIYAEQGPDARKKDLDEATIAILEDEMLYREKLNKKFKDRLTAMNDEELLAARERERKCSGSGMARMNWLGFMREEMERRGIKIG